jgi:hypothetical protein
LRAENGWLKQKLFRGGAGAIGLDLTQLLLKLSKLEKLAVLVPPVKIMITYERTEPTGEKRFVPAATFPHCR